MTELLLYDSIPNPSHQRGVDRYFREIVRGVAHDFGARASILSGRRWDTALRRYPLHRLPRRYLGKNIRSHQATVMTRLIRPSVVFSPYFGRLRTSASEAFALYDMAYERLPAHFPAHLAAHRDFIEEKRACLERADLIIAISHATASECLDIYPDLDPKKFVVVHLGVDTERFARAPGSSRAGRPYFLYVGTRGVYKNFRSLVRAFAESGLARDCDLRVVSPGRHGFDAEESELLTQLGVAGSVHLHTDIDDDELATLYSNAIGLVFPSEYEGFGLPILEAMASGTLVATSDLTSMPEVGGDVAFYFDPTDPTHIAEKMLHMAELPTADREARCAAGVERSEQFSWDACRARTNAALRGLL